MWNTGAGYWLGCNLLNNVTGDQIFGVHQQKRPATLRECLLANRKHLDTSE
jgi:hypothetical protein